MERLKEVVPEHVRESVPGTAEYEKTHGVDQLHSTVEQAKSFIPGTTAYYRRKEGDPAYQTTGPTGQPVYGIIGTPLSTQAVERAAYNAAEGLKEIFPTHMRQKQQQQHQQHNGAAPSAQRRADT